LEDGVNKPDFLVLFIITLLISIGTKAYGLAESTGPGGSNAQAVHKLGQTGAGIKIGLISGRNVYANHEAFFNGRVINYDFSGDGIQEAVHDTWMAGIAISGGGASNPDDVGVAPGAKVYSARVGDNSNAINFYELEDALTNLIDVQGCRVIMTGFALGGDPNGQGPWTLMYDYYAYEKDVVFAIPAGNGGSTIEIFGDAYNGITTGGLVTVDDDIYDKVGSVSGEGLTSDGRRKPDVVAPSSIQTVPYEPNIWAVPPWYGGQTSLSVPHTAGLAALLLGYADQTAEADDGEKEVIKAVIVNSAFPNIKAKSGASTYPTEPNNVWHEERGYGRIDALRAYRILSSEHINPDDDVTALRGWAYETMNNLLSQEHHFYIHIDSGRWLVLTVTWNRRVAKIGGIYQADSPMWNFDLEVKDPCGITLFEESEGLNNLQKLDLPLYQQGGRYEVIVSKSMTGRNHSYGLAFDLPLLVDFNFDYAVDYNDLGILASDWLQTDSQADVTGEGDVNLRDFAVFANHYTSLNPLYR
jgi:hypothetical protein